MSEQEAVQSILNWLAIQAARRDWQATKFKKTGREIEGAAEEVVAACYRAIQDEIAQGRWKFGKPAVHLWVKSELQTKCAMPGLPGSWPEGHRWSEDLQEVTCEWCRK